MMKLILIAIVLLATTGHAQEHATLVNQGSFPWTTSGLRMGNTLATFNADYTRITFTPDAAEMRVCVPSGQCRSVFEIAAWMDNAP